LACSEIKLLYHPAKKNNPVLVWIGGKRSRKGQSGLGGEEKIFSSIR
jgi:hypothetical protein